MLFQDAFSFSRCFSCDLNDDGSCIGIGIEKTECAKVLNVEYSRNWEKATVIGELMITENVT